MDFQQRKIFFTNILIQADPPTAIQKISGIIQASLGPISLQGYLRYLRIFNAAEVGGVSLFINVGPYSSVSAAVAIPPQTEWKSDDVFLLLASDETFAQFGLDVTIASFVQIQKSDASNFDGTEFVAVAGYG